MFELFESLQFENKSVIDRRIKELSKKEFKILFFINFDLEIPTGFTGYNSYFNYLIQQADDNLSFSIERDEDGETKHDGYVKLYPIFEIDENVDLFQVSIRNQFCILNL